MYKPVVAVVLVVVFAVGGVGVVMYEPVVVVLVLLMCLNLFLLLLQPFLRSAKNFSCLNETFSLPFFSAFATEHKIGKNEKTRNRSLRKFRFQECFGLSRFRARIGSSSISGSRLQAQS